MHKSATAIVLGVTLLFAACSGNGSPADEVSDEFLAAAEDAVAAAVLTLDDLPAGWTAEPQDDDDDEDAEFSGECARLNQDEFPGEVASADSDKLTGPDNQIVYASAIAFASEDLARNALESYQLLENDCRNQLEDVLTSAFRESFAEDGVSDAELATLQVTVEDLAFPRIRESLTAYRVVWRAELRGMPIGGTMDFTFWREGKMFGGIVYLAFGNGPDMADEEGVAKILADKVKQANDSLPS